MQELNEISSETKNKRKNRLDTFRAVKRNLVYGMHDLLRSTFRQNALTQIVNASEVRVIGMKRTGNHAITNWVKKQQTGEVWHLNNVPAKQNPYRYLYQHFPKDHLRREAFGKFTLKDRLIYSYEDWDLDQITASEFEKRHDFYIGKSANRYDLLIMRDPFNLFASRVKCNYIYSRWSNKSLVDLWLEYAKEYLNETNYLKHNKIALNYNLWVTDQDYRKHIADQLNIEFTDAGIGDVKTEGGGSSFDGLKFSGNARQMDVIGRWKHFLDNDLYRNMLKNEELLHYSEKIFGHIPGTEVLLSTSSNYFNARNAV